MHYLPMSSFSVFQLNVSEISTLVKSSSDEYLVQWGVRQIRLRVGKKNNLSLHLLALHLFESSGFRVTGIAMFMVVIVAIVAAPFVMVLFVTVNFVSILFVAMYLACVRVARTTWRARAASTDNSARYSCL